MHRPSVRIDVTTHGDLKRLAAEQNTTVGDVVKLAVRAMRQHIVGEQLASALQVDEERWLGADLS